MKRIKYLFSVKSVCFMMKIYLGNNITEIRKDVK